MLSQAARVAIRDCMGIRAGEDVLVVSDPPLREIGQALWEEAVAVGAEAVYMEFPSRQVHGEEPPVAVAEAMARAQVVLAATSKSLSHTKARLQACAAGARVATLPGITQETMIRTMGVDYREIAHRSRLVASRMDQAHEVVLTTPLGTDLRLSLKGRKGLADEGMVIRPGQFGNLPGGEAFIAPVEGEGEGILIIDGAMSGLGMLKEPLRLEIRGGIVVGISGAEANRLEALLEKAGPKARVIAELGVGTNHGAQICGHVLEDEKVLGTVHLAVGNNTGFGGTNDVALHLDGIITRPTLLLDGEPLLEDGVLRVDLGEGGLNG